MWILAAFLVLTVITAKLLLGPSARVDTINRAIDISNARAAQVTARLSSFTDASVKGLTPDRRTNALKITPGIDYLVRECDGSKILDAVDAAITRLAVPDGFSCTARFLISANPPKGSAELITESVSSYPMLAPSEIAIPNTFLLAHLTIYAVKDDKSWILAFADELYAMRREIRGLLADYETIERWVQPGRA